MKKLAIRYKPVAKEGRTTPRILDVGSGNNALDIATHLLDRYPDNNHERGGDMDIPPGKEFREGDVECIPFPEGYFDFAHASHVLEHTEEPRRAILELTRVAHAGYIETPAAVIEQGTVLPGGLPGAQAISTTPGWSFHRWMVWCFPGQPTLYLRPKTAIALDTTCSCAASEAYRKIRSKINLLELDPHLPYFCKMTQFLWTTRSPGLEIWTEKQQGRLTPELGSCNCAYSAFFAWGRVYFSSFRQIWRRWKFRRALPEVFALYKQASLKRPSKASAKKRRGQSEFAQ